MDSSEIPAARGKLLRRQLSSRLQQQAPASIQIAPATAAARVAGWNAAIPLLSPLDIAAVTDGAPLEGGAREEQRAPSAAGEGEGPARWPAWQHPAAPFYCEPVPGGAPALILPRYA